MYEYQCPACQATFEELVASFAAADRVACPKCGHRPVTRRPSVFAARASATPTSPPPGGCGSSCSASGTCPWRS
ncbi:MAG: FmdB family zinc ribbon protein [Planctomycetota bacterium]